MRTMAEAGVLDLRNHDFTRRPLAHLHGYWRFTWQKFVTPPGIAPNARQKPTQSIPAGQTLPDAADEDAPLYLHIPGTWAQPHNYRPRPPQRTGNKHQYGTYQLTVQLAPDAPERLYIYCPEQRDAYRLYVNRADGPPDAPVCSSGEAADSRAATLPLLHSSVRDFQRNGNVLVFTLHVAHRASGAGGAMEPPLIGKQEAVQYRRERGIIFHLMLAGALFMIALYHFVLYSLRQRSLAPLYLGLLAAIFGLRLMFLGERIGSEILAHIIADAGQITARILFGTFFWGAMVCFLFIKTTFSRFTPAWTRKAILISHLPFGLAGLFGPIEWLATLGLAFLPILATAAALSLRMIYRARHEQTGARASLIGGFILAITVMHDLLVWQGIIYTTPLSGVGLLALVVSQSVTLQIHSEQAYTSTEALSEKLEIEVSDRTAELTRSNHALEEALIAAESASRAKSEFVANMSHEIRTPMNAILGFSSILGERVKEPQLREYLRTISSSGRMLLKLINDILDLSRIESGQMALNAEAVSIREIVEDLRGLFRERAKEQGLDFEVQAAADLPATLYLDEVRLRQVLVNLIGNALKFTEEGFVRVSAYVRLTDKNDPTRHTLVLTVQDSGIGIGSTEQHEIFEAFGQAHQESQRYGGVGLGLSICRRLLDIMGGTISVVSEAGRGSQFVVEIPDLRSGDAGDPAQSEAGRISIETLLQQGLQFEPARILIADDVSTNRQLLREFLSGQPFEFFEAADGEEVLKLARETHPDLILMDMKMPLLGGKEATRTLKEAAATSEIPVIAVTASVLEHLAEEIRALCDGYLRKPVMKAELLGEMVRFLPHTSTAAADTNKGGASHPDSAGSPAGAQPAPMPAPLQTALAELTGEWQTLRETRPIHGISSFARRVGALATTHNHDGTRIWAEQLATASENLDITRMAELLEAFPVQAPE